MSDYRKAVILLSGGLDSTTVLAIAKSEGFTPYALSFRYGQRHSVELEAAAKVANSSAGGVTIEGEAVDSVSGDRVFGLIGSHKGSRWDAVRTQDDAWKLTKSSIDSMTRFVRELMDRAQSGTLEPS